MKLSVSSEYDNVAIFVSDAMRYDSAADAFDNHTVHKSVSSGLSSPAGFASIITGHYPTRHGVTSFSDRMDRDLPTVFDLRPNTTFYNEGKELGNVLGTSESVPHGPLEQLKEPFLYFERDLIPHAPFNYVEDEYDGSVRDYCEERRGQAVADYHASVDNSVAKFERRVETLRDRDLLENTLVIFTADHGELVGEYGRVGHGSPSCPELAYVPLVFYNDDVTLEDDGRGTLAQVDLLPTLESILGETVTDETHPGVNLCNEVPADRRVFNQCSDDEWSVWDRHGGHIFSTQDLVYRTGWWGIQLTRSPYAPLQRRHPIKLLRTALRGYRSESITVGSPKFDSAEAVAFADRLFARVTESGATQRESVDSEHLEALGYLE